MASQTDKIVVVMIHFDSAEFLKLSVPSILEQTYDNLQLIFIDNNSKNREGLEFMHNNYDKEPRVRIIANTDNRGYSKSANQGIKIAVAHRAKYVCIANPDVIFSLDYFEKAVKKLKSDQKIASISGKIYAYDVKNDKPTDIIDGTGFDILKNRRVVDFGRGVIDSGQFNKEKEVFGVPSICPIYRVKALEEVKIFEEYFDEDFFMYKEDADLCWRFLLYGWKNIYYPEIVAYHARNTAVRQGFTTSQYLENRRTLSRLQKQLSFRNQLLMQAKNEIKENYYKDLLPIMLMKLLSPFYITFREPYLWISYFDYLKKLPKALKKRKEIMKNKKATAEEMQKWFISKHKED